MISADTAGLSVWAVLAAGIGAQPVTANATAMAKKSDAAPFTGIS
jgi:hypothetical protein